MLKLQPKFLLGLKKDLGLADPDRFGILVLEEFFCQKHGRSKEFLHSLIMRYPYLLNKTKAHIQGVFDLLASHGIDEKEAIKHTFECPKLFSVNLGKQMQEIFALFKLYNKIEEPVVMTMFKSFPYLFCCDTIKTRKFLAEFKKYKMTEDQIVKVVSGLKLTSFRSLTAVGCWPSRCQTSRVCLIT